MTRKKSYWNAIHKQRQQEGKARAHPEYEVLDFV